MAPLPADSDSDAAKGGHAGHGGGDPMGMDAMPGLSHGGAATAPAEAAPDEPAPAPAPAAEARLDLPDAPRRARRGARPLPGLRHAAGRAGRRRPVRLRSTAAAHPRRRARRRVRLHLAARGPWLR